MIEDIISQIPLSYLNMLAEDNDECCDTVAEMELAMFDLREGAESFRLNKTTIDDFKAVLIELVNKETDKLILSTDGENVVPDEEVRALNARVISGFSVAETRAFAKSFHAILRQVWTSAQWIRTNKPQIMIPSEQNRPTLSSLEF